MSGDGFPDVVWIAAHRDRFTAMNSRQIDAIVLHATEGRAVDAQVTARNVFAQPRLVKNGRVQRQSAHYVIGRDGKVVQCVRHKDVAYHANTENSYTIGIEHNSRNPEDKSLTDKQYWNSAKLVVWLCRQFELEIDRWHIQGHSEIDTATTHTSCPQRVLNWDTYMRAVGDVLNLEKGKVSMRLWDQ